MLFPDFLPIENRGMSIITAICLFFILIGVWIYFWWDKREHARLMTYTNELSKISDKQTEETMKKVETLFHKNDELNRDLSYIKSHVAAIHESVGWIKEYIKEDKQR